MHKINVRKSPQTGVGRFVPVFAYAEGNLRFVRHERLRGLAVVIGLLRGLSLVKVTLDPRHRPKSGLWDGIRYGNRILKPVTPFSRGAVFFGSTGAQKVMGKLFEPAKSAHFRSLMAARVFGDPFFLKIKVDPKLAGVETLEVKDPELHGRQFRLVSRDGTFYAKGMATISGRVPNGWDALVSPDCVKSTRKEFGGHVWVGAISRPRAGHDSALTPLGAMFIALAERLPGMSQSIKQLEDHAVSRFQECLDSVEESLALAVDDGWISELAPRVGRRLRVAAKAFSLGWNPKVVGFPFVYADVLEQTLASKRSRVVRSLGLSGVSLKRLPLPDSGGLARDVVVTDAVPPGPCLAWRSPVLGADELHLGNVVSTYEAIEMGLLTAHEARSGESLVWCSREWAKEDKGDFDGDQMTVLGSSTVPNEVWKAVEHCTEAVQKRWNTEGHNEPLFQVSESSDASLGELCSQAFELGVDGLQGTFTLALKGAVEEILKGCAPQKRASVLEDAYALGATVDVVTKLHKRHVGDLGGFLKSLGLANKWAKGLSKMSSSLGKRCYIWGSGAEDPDGTVIGRVAAQCNEAYMERYEKLRAVPMDANHLQEWCDALRVAWLHNSGKPMPKSLLRTWSDITRAPEVVRESWDLWCLGDGSHPGSRELSALRKNGVIDLDDHMEALEELGLLVSDHMAPFWDSLSGTDTAIVVHAMILWQVSRRWSSTSFLLHSGAFDRYLAVLERLREYRG